MEVSATTTTATATVTTTTSTTTLSNDSVISQVKVHIGLLESASINSNGTNDGLQEDEKRMVGRVLHHLLSKLRLALRESRVMAELITTYPVASVLNPNTANCNLGATATAYLWLLTVIYLHDTKHPETRSTAVAAVEAVQSANNRSLDLILAKLYFYLYQASSSSSIGSLRGFLMVGLRLSSLRHDHETNAVIHNLILRSYVTAEQHDVALKFTLQSAFPPIGSSNTQLARHHYYLARIHAVQTDYPKATEHLAQALRKAPHGRNAAGFVQAACKLQVVTLLLSGELPERSLFKQPYLRGGPLSAYHALTVAVRSGDLAQFQAVLSEHQARFIGDSLYTLILRLHQNVLKTGLRRLYLAYTRIPLSGVAQKLRLPSIDDAEFVVMKAIKDGVFGASNDHHHHHQSTTSAPRIESGAFLGKPAATTHFYATAQPQTVLHQRITQCQQLFAETVKAMRFPQGAKSTKDPNAATTAPVTDLELLEEYMDEVGDDTMDF